MTLTDFPNLLKASFELDERSNVIRSPLLDSFLWLTHGVTTRRFEVNDWDTFALIEQVRARLVPGGLYIFCCEQVHGNKIGVIEAGKPRGWDGPARERGVVVQLLGADGLIVSAPSIPIAIRTADCVPVLIADVRRRRVALVHAGWRGSFDRIGEKAVAELKRLGTDPADLVVWMGPAISRDAYEVGKDLGERFHREFPDCEGVVVDNHLDGARDTPVPHHLDLILLNACLLHAAGIPAAQIHAANYCTFRNRDTCFSYRAERDRAGRMVTYAMILPECDAVPPTSSTSSTKSISSTKST